MRVQVVVAHDERFRILRLQLLHQALQRFPLLWCSCIARVSGGIQPAFVADAERVAVVPLTMRSHLFRRPSLMDDAVAGDVVVIAYVAEASVADVVHAASLEIQVPPLRGGGTMDDKQGNGSHLRQRELELKPNAPAMADNTVVMIFKISPSLLLGFGLLERFVFIKIKD